MSDHGVRDCGHGALGGLVLNSLMKPKGSFDKQLAKIAQQKVWESVPQCVDFLVALVTNNEASNKDRIAAAKLLLDRTIPTVSRIDASGLVGLLAVQGQGEEINWGAIYDSALEISRVEVMGNGDDRDSRIH